MVQMPVPPEGEESEQRRPTRRPKDYFHMLPKPRQKRLRDRIRRAYANTRFPEDCAQEACIQMLTYRYDLEIGPELMPVPTAAWFDQVEDALERFAKARQMKRSVTRIVYSANELHQFPDDAALEEPDPNWDSDIRWREDRKHWATVLEASRALLIAQPDSDPLVIQLLDQLRHNAVAETTDQSMDEVFRGDTSQVNHEPLLRSLILAHPSVGWDIALLRRTIAKLFRQWDRLRQRLTADGLLPFDDAKRRNTP